MKKNQSGNVIFFILLAIFLLGLVTAALRSTGIESSGIEREDLSIKISQVRQNAGEIEHAVNLALQNGISESDISFAAADAPSAYGTYNANPKAEIFNPAGGAARFRSAPSGINDGSGWEFYGNTAIPQMGTDKAELVAVLPNVTEAFCTAINAQAGQTTVQPTDDGSCVNAGPSSRFSPLNNFAASPNTMNEATFTLMPAPEACVQCNAGSTTFNYYHVLMAR